GTGRKQRLKQPDVRRDAEPRPGQPIGETLFQVPGGRVERTVQRLRIAIEDFAMRPGAAADIDELESRAGLDFKAQFNGIWSHRRSPGPPAAEGTSAERAPQIGPPPRSSKIRPMFYAFCIGCPWCPPCSFSSSGSRIRNVLPLAP